MRIAIVTAALVVPLLVACASVPDGVTVWVESPPSVELSERFTISAHVENASSSSVTLRTLDIGDSYLEGVAILGCTPPFFDSTHVPIDNTMSFWFELEVAPGEHLVVTFQAEARKVGVQQGDFDLCVNALANCSFQTITTPVRTPW